MPGCQNISVLILYYSIFLHELLGQLEFQDPKMEVLYHMSGHIVGVYPIRSPYVGLVVGTSHQLVPIAWPLSRGYFCGYIHWYSLLGFCWELVFWNPPLAFYLEPETSGEDHQKMQPLAWRDHTSPKRRWYTVRRHQMVLIRWYPLVNVYITDGKIHHL